MKIIEYLYLGATGFLAAVLVQTMRSGTTLESGLILTGIVVFSFMYSFRRSQRLRAEQQQKKRDKQEN